MATTAETLIEIAKSVAPSGGFFGYYDLVDALEANPEALERFKATLAVARPEDLDGVDELDEELGWIVMGAADAMDLLPDDPRSFLSEADVAALRDDEKIGALRTACIMNDVATVERLAGQLNVNALDHHYQSALCYAVGNNHPKCVGILLAHGADPNLVLKWGNTAMHHCADTVSSKEIYQMLLAAGGDPSIKNNEGRTVVDLLRRHRRLDWMTE